MKHLCSTSTSSSTSTSITGAAAGTGAKAPGQGGRQAGRRGEPESEFGPSNRDPHMLCRPIITVPCQHNSSQAYAGDAGGHGRCRQRDRTRDAAGCCDVALQLRERRIFRKGQHLHDGVALAAAGSQFKRRCG